MPGDHFGVMVAGLAGFLVAVLVGAWIFLLATAHDSGCPRGQHEIVMSPGPPRTYTCVG